MPNSDKLHALNIPKVSREDLAPDLKKYFDVCDEKLGMVPNVLQSYAFSEDKLRGFMGMYNELMLGESGLTKLEREMIAVVVSSFNHCYYCLVAHGAAVRELSGTPELGEQLIMNYRVADLPHKQMAMLDFAYQITAHPDAIVEADRQTLRDAGWSDHDIWDIAATAGFFNMSNRMASAIDMQPNPEYHAQNR